MKNIIWSDERDLLKMVVNVNNNNIYINIMGDNGVSSVSLDEEGVESLIKYLNLYLENKNKNVVSKESVEKMCSEVWVSAMEEINAMKKHVSEFKSEANFNPDTYETLNVPESIESELGKHYGDSIVNKLYILSSDFETIISENYILSNINPYLIASVNKNKEYRKIHGHELIGLNVRWCDDSEYLFQKLGVQRSRTTRLKDKVGLIVGFSRDRDTFLVAFKGERELIEFFGENICDNIVMHHTQFARKK